MDTDEICNLNVQSICDNNCVLFLWVVNNMLADGLKVMSSWGFAYRTIGFVWVKYWGKSLKLGLGFYTRPSAELVLLGVKGHLKRHNNSVYQVVQSQVGRHSEKPNEVRDRIVQLYGDVSRIELFARQKTDGWDVWGNEVESTIPLDLTHL